MQRENRRQLPELRDAPLAQFTPEQTQDILKIYAQGPGSAAHLRGILSKAQMIIDQALNTPRVPTR